MAHGGRTEQIALISMDMSPAYQSGASRFFPQAQIVFDRFHLMQMAGQAVDKVRKELARQGADLKGSLWALRGNEWTRSQEQREQRSTLCNRYPKLGRAIGLRDMLQDILADEDPRGPALVVQAREAQSAPTFSRLGTEHSRTLERGRCLPENSTYQWRHRGG